MKGDNFVFRDKPEIIVTNENRAPLGFGLHPNLKKYWENFSLKTIKEMDLEEAMFGKQTPLSAFVDPRHPDVFVIPRDRHLNIVDQNDETIGFMRINLPFSSTDFYTDLVYGKNLFSDLYLLEAFHRLGGISQLGYLVPPRPDDWSQKIRVCYLYPQFAHTRWIHSLLTGILMELVLARNGFSREERTPTVLAAACHDIAMPAGGDSIKRVDKENLNEERNFAWVLGYHSLDKRWAKLYGFDVDLAKKWVQGEGVMGKLLDALDKISYTALDCWRLGSVRSGKVRNLCLKYPLIMDVWQDIRFDPKHDQFGFVSPERLFRFLLLRAYEHSELLLNPYSRILDFYLEKFVRQLYERGVVTKEQLLLNSDDWLHNLLNHYFPQEFKWLLEPEKFSWRKFKTKEEQDNFCEKLGNRFDHAEYIAGFATGLDWPVFRGETLVTLKEVIGQQKIKWLEQISASTRGYYVYFKS